MCSAARVLDLAPHRALTLRFGFGVIVDGVKGIDSGESAE
jgi:hypothetical protein